MTSIVEKFVSGPDKKVEAHYFFSIEDKFLMEVRGLQDLMLRRINARFVEFQAVTKILASCNARSQLQGSKEYDAFVQRVARMCINKNWNIVHYNICGEIVGVYFNE